MSDTMGPSAPGDQTRSRPVGPAVGGPDPLQSSLKTCSMAATSWASVVITAKSRDVE